jgi:hypothetical protein
MVKKMKKVLAGTPLAAPVLFLSGGCPHPLWITLGGTATKG